MDPTHVGVRRAAALSETFKSDSSSMRRAHYSALWADRVPYTARPRAPSWWGGHCTCIAAGGRLAQRSSWHAGCAGSRPAPHVFAGMVPHDDVAGCGPGCASDGARHDVEWTNVARGRAAGDDDAALPGRGERLSPSTCLGRSGLSAAERHTCARPSEVRSLKLSEVLLCISTGSPPGTIFGLACQAGTAGTLPGSWQEFCERAIVAQFGVDGSRVGPLCWVWDLGGIADDKVGTSLRIW